MALKQTALIKCSSRLLGRNDVLERVHTIGETYALRFLGGGGEQISAAFEERGWENKFGPFGRICVDFDQRLLAENILKKNAADFEDQLQSSGVFAQMVLPVLDSEVGQVTCHVNGDMYPVICYNGYDHFFVFTMEGDVEQKRRYYRAMWQLNRMHLADRSIPTTIEIDTEDFPPKIEVVGFPSRGF
jgi:hypothetical protein